MFRPVAEVWGWMRSFHAEIRGHFYAERGDIEDLIEFLEDRSCLDWLVARKMPLRRSALIACKRTHPSILPHLVYPSDPSFAADPELLFAPAMTNLILQLPTGHFLVRKDAAPLCYTSVMEQESEHQLRFLDAGDWRITPAIAKAPFSWHW
jgi:hypothetical protein